MSADTTNPPGEGDGRFPSPAPAGERRPARRTASTFRGAAG
jgi:hypothetical protein